MIFYLCDGKNECNIDSNCYVNGGACRHTLSPSHAKNFEARECESFPLLGDYWEKGDREMGWYGKENFRV